MDDTITKLKEILTTQSIALVEAMASYETSINIPAAIETQAKLRDLIDTGTFIHKQKNDNITESNTEIPQENEDTENEDTDPTSYNDDIQKGKFCITLYGGVIHANESHIVSQSFIRKNGLEHDDTVHITIAKYKDHNEIVLHRIERPLDPQVNRYKEIKVPVKISQDNVYYADTDIDGDPIFKSTGQEIYYFVEGYITGSDLKKNDIVTLRYDSTLDKPRLYCVWLDRTDKQPETVQPQTTPKKKKSKIINPSECITTWAFDLEDRKIGIIGGDVFHASWKKPLEDHNGDITFLKQGKKVKGLSPSAKSIVESSDMVLLCKNMLNHPAANAIRKYAKDCNVPCESFEGFSVNQIFASVKTIIERGN